MPLALMIFSPWFLKEYADEIAPILTDICQDSIESELCPVDGKQQMYSFSLKMGKSVILPTID